MERVDVQGFISERLCKSVLFRYARFREKQFVCDVCDRSFTMKQNMAHHFYQVSLFDGGH